MAMLLEKHGAKKFFIVDDLFGHNRKETMRLCKLLEDYQKAVDVQFSITVQIRLDRGRDTEMLQAMRRAGVKVVCIGFESPIKEELLAMDKRVKPEKMLALTRRFHKAGFMVHGMFIFGYPLQNGATLDMPIEERVKQFRKFIKKSHLDTIQVLLPVPLPGTEMTARLAKEDRVFPRDQIGWEYYDGNFPLFMPDAPLTPEDLQRANQKIMGRFYRFRSMFAIVRNVMIFPAMLSATLWNVKMGWRIWHRKWRTDLIHFGGWLTFKNWINRFRKGSFPDKLSKAKSAVNKSEKTSGA
jgi:radical SAM superfamily enzyme YgiQ (UPF0313 family)